MAKAVKEGLLPYRDFFYAHPPFQLFLFQPALLFGANFIVIKIFITTLSIGCVILTYLIAKELFGNPSAFLASLFFLIFPGFLIFSNQGMGMFEALLFFLSGFYFLIKKRILFSSILLSIAIFTRYLTILLIPFLFLYILQFDRKNLTKFTKFLLLTTITTAAALVLFFGENFLIDTLAYHTQVNLSIKAGLAQFLNQYLTLGFFTVFLSLIALFFVLFRKNDKILLFVAYSLVYDFLILLSLKMVLYHYFILTLPLVFISTAAVFTKAKYFIVRAFIIVVLILSIASNLVSVELFFDKTRHEVFPALESYVEENLDKNDSIFGEPRIVNYLSFVTGVKIANNYFDADLKFINFAGREKVFNEVNKIKPKIIIDNGYIPEFKGYSLVDKWEVPKHYSIKLYKLA